MWHRKTQQEPDVSEAAVPDKRRRRGGRGWGPFSGGQLTIIVVTFAVMLLFPVGAWALSFTNVAIIDPGGVNRAKVNASGQLSTIAGVSGSVTATPTPPSSSYHTTSFFHGEACSNVTGAVPAGKALVVTSVTVNIVSVTTGPVSFNLGAGTTGSPCTVAANLEVGWVSGARVSSIIPFASGLPIKSGHTLDVSMSSTSSDAIAGFEVHGYLVASALCGTGTTPPIGCI